LPLPAPSLHPIEATPPVTAYAGPAHATFDDAVDAAVALPSSTGFAGVSVTASCYVRAGGS